MANPENDLGQDQKNRQQEPLETQGKELLEEFLSEKADIYPFPIGIVNPEGKVMFGNKRFKEIISLTPENQGTFSLLTSQQEIEALGEVAEGTRKSYSTIVPDPNKKGKWLQIDFDPVPFAEGRIVTARATDVTMLKDETECLRARNQTMEANARTVGHDIRSDMASIPGAAQVIETNLGDTNPLLKRMLEIIKRSVKKTAETSLELYDLEHVAKKEQIDMTQLLKRINEAYAFKYPSVRIHANFAENIPVLELDPIQMEKVFNNLLANAVQADATTITVTGFTIIDRIRRKVGGEEAIEEKPMARFSVKDNGQGIPPKAEEHIYEKDFTTKRGGTGTGLFDVARFVRANGGRINHETLHVKTKQENPRLYQFREAGTTFTVDFPIE